jgi:hypothetical protein
MECGAPWRTSAAAWSPICAGLLAEEHDDKEEGGCGGVSVSEWCATRGGDGGGDGSAFFWLLLGTPRKKNKGMRETCGWRWGW